jgi:cell fate regulator YaaT (PSP1 superfamily)
MGCVPAKDGSKSCATGGSCSTGGCNKLNVYDWLTGMALPTGQKPFDIIEVRFKGTRKEFFRNKENFNLGVGDVVAVESMPGHDVGVVSLAGELVRFQMKKKNVPENSETIKALYRKAKQNEIDKWHEMRAKEKPVLMRTRDIIKSLNLQMKLSDVEYQADGKKATFYYTADERVDFRELIKRLADEFKTRVEMRQVGMRQEAGRLGGIGSCGRELCCATWLTDFRTVTTSAARYQNLALNPAKLAGQCGKLKCCLNYELDSYMDALRDFPNVNTVLETANGRAFHRKTDIFKRMMWFAFTPELGQQEAEAGYDGNWVPLPVDRVNEIIAMNKKNERPAELRVHEEVEIEYKPDFENVVGQDRIDRMDHKKKKKSKRRKPDNRNRNQSPQQNQQQQNQNPNPNPNTRGNKPRQNPGPNQNPNQNKGPRQGGGGPKPGNTK